MNNKAFWNGVGIGIGFFLLFCILVIAGAVVATNPSILIVR
jgi:hypothetical protein